MKEQSSRMNRPRFIYFDLGNVLLYFDHQVACEQMGRLAGVDAAFVRKIVFESSLQDKYESGQISCEEFFEHFCKQSKAQVQFEELLNGASDIFVQNHRIVPIVIHLASQNIPLGILSNTCKAHWEFVKKNFEMLRHFFQEYALSYELKSMKPAPSIYQQASKLAQVEPGDIFFLDDRQENVDGAIAAGFDAVLFRDCQTLAHDLQQRGIEFNF
jgi:putative hydrolase of the HAD superfamily